MEKPSRPAGLFAGSIIVAFAVWQFLSTVVFNPFLIPPPLVVFKTMVPMIENGEIFRHVAISLARVGVVSSPDARRRSGRCWGASSW